MAAEVDDFSKELYKIQKVFINRYKKLQSQRDDRERERKKNLQRVRRSSRKASGVDLNRPSVAGVEVPRPSVFNAGEADASDDDQPEPPVQPPAAISVSAKVIAQINEFRVQALTTHLTVFLELPTNVVKRRALFSSGLNPDLNRDPRTANSLEQVHLSVHADGNYHLWDGRPITASVTEVSHAHSPSTRRSIGVLIDRCRQEFLSTTNVGKCELRVIWSLQVLARARAGCRPEWVGTTTTTMTLNYGHFQGQPW